MVVIERFCYSDFATFGFLHLPSGQVLATVERPWMENKKRISCIPNGNYYCAPKYYFRGGYDAVEVKDVPNRSHILFHVGNFVRNSNGCILVNTSHGSMGGEWCGVGSKMAFNSFIDTVGSKPFNLIIKDRKGADLC